MNLYVGNLSRSVTEADLELIFEGLGQGASAQAAGAILELLATRREPVSCAS